MDGEGSNRTVSGSLDPEVARRTWRTVEPVHGLIYFAPEAASAYSALGLDGMQGYFASRAAAMGAVSSEVVVATFFNFHPPMVRAAMDGVWERTTPDQLVAARASAAGDMLRRVLGPAADSAEVARAASLARRAAERAAEMPEGRPLFAGQASLGWPDDPIVELWHAQNLLREFRGDGHIAVLVAEGVDGVEALVLHAATGEVPAQILRATRAWPEQDWSAAQDRLRSRGWLDADGELTDAGREHRAHIESRTDALAVAAYEALGEDGCQSLRELVRPWSRAIVASGSFGF